MVQNPRYRAFTPDPRILNKDIQGICRPHLGGTVKGVSVESVIVQEALSKTGDREGTYYKNMIFLTLEETA